MLHFIRGFLMGSADVVPGVSGGTVALIVGIILIALLMFAIRDVPAVMASGTPVRTPTPVLAHAPPQVCARRCPAGRGLSISAAPGPARRQHASGRTRAAPMAANEVPRAAAPRTMRSLPFGCGRRCWAVCGVGGAMAAEPCL